MWAQLLSHSVVSLSDHMGYSPPSSSVHGIFQVKTLEWVAISFTRGSSQPRDRTRISCVSCTGRWILYHWARGHAQSYWWSEVKSLSHVRLFATPWTVAYQAPPSMGFSRQECWNGLPTHKCYQIWVQFTVSLWWRSWVSWLLWGSNTPAAIWELGGDNRWQREVW